MFAVNDIEEICGEIHIGATGVEWICVRQPHDDIGGAHYFVNRKPSREDDDD